MIGVLIDKSFQIVFKVKNRAVSWVFLTIFKERTASKMTPAKAIKEECKFCMGDVKKQCESTVCKLNDKSLSRLKRIKLHCIDCVGKKSEVNNCTGKLLNENRICYLHQYRDGHNPKRKGIGGFKKTKKSLTHDKVLTV